jgi:hypothetical protein
MSKEALPPVPPAGSDWRQWIMWAVIALASSLATGIACKCTEEGHAAAPVMPPAKEFQQDAGQLRPGKTCCRGTPCLDCCDCCSCAGKRKQDTAPQKAPPGKTCCRGTPCLDCCDCCSCAGKRKQDTAPKAPPGNTNSLKGPAAPGNCVEANTPVFTDKGAVEISKLDPKKHAILYRPKSDGLHAYTHNYRVCWTGRATSLVRVSVAGGRYLDCTPRDSVSHVVLSSEVSTAAHDDRWGFKQARHLTKSCQVWTYGTWQEDPKEDGPEIGAPYWTNARVADVAVIQAPAGRSFELWSLTNLEDCEGDRPCWVANGIVVHNN